MFNSRTKDKIYAFISFLAIVLLVGSFAFIVNFLLKMNNYVFNVSEEIVKEKTTVVDKAGFESIIKKMNERGVNGSEKFLLEEKTPVKSEAPSENRISIEETEPILSPVPSSSVSPEPSMDSDLLTSPVPTGEPAKDEQTSKLVP